MLFFDFKKFVQTPIYKNENKIYNTNEHFSKF